MNPFWEAALRPVMDAVQPHCVIEVGAAAGGLTAKLLDWAAAHDATVHAIDPCPALDVTAWRAEHRGRFVFHKARSLNVLGRVQGVDVAWIDGDHNYYTVVHELRLLERAALRADHPPPVIGLHDVDWPYGSRDLYYDPDSVPPAHRLPYERKGILPGEGELSHAGFNDHLCNAIHDHSAHNGVCAAIDDFIAKSDLRWQLHRIPGLHGLGVLVSDDRLAASPRLGPVLRSFGSARFLRRWCGDIELARVRAEIAVAVGERELTNARVHVHEFEVAHRESERVLVDRLERGRAARDALGAEIERLQHRLALAADTEAQLRRDLVAARAQLADAECERLVAPKADAASTNGSNPPRSGVGAS